MFKQQGPQIPLQTRQGRWNSAAKAAGHASDVIHLAPNARAVLID
jgi:hypothetical protein